MTGGILIVCYAVNLVVWSVFHAATMVPMIFVLGVFLISLCTKGHFWGVAASLLSMLIVNYTFTHPYNAFDFGWTVNLFSAVVMMIVATVTSALTTKIKEHEKIRAESEREAMRANLLRAISHDLRTPLTSIYGSASAILENYDTLGNCQKQRLLRDMQEDADSLWQTELFQ